MAQYKGVAVGVDVVDLVRHMGHVDETREALQRLQGIWDHLAMLGEFSGTGVEIAGVRAAFDGLTSTLIDQLARESRRKTVSALRGKAQVAIDTLVRNLFERTADVGFLATDDALRRFAENADPDPARPALVERLRAYRASYTVYDDVIVLDPVGRVLARLAPCSVESTDDPFVREAACGTEPWVEAFGRFGLLPGRERALVYARQMRSADGRRGVGVLCLSFALDDECRRIFDGLRRPDDWRVLALVDAGGRVVASSDALQLPPGVSLGATPGSRVLRFGGRRWLAVTCAPRPYQGYAGPGWLGLALVPLDLAFDTDDRIDDPSLSAARFAALAASPLLYSDGLRAIPPAAAAIESDLRRAVWNGHVALCSAPADRDAGFARALLREIGQTGARTRQAFTGAIDELNRTVVSALLDDTAARAALAIDLLDRNLYERANDCRWWALTGVFRRVLEDGPGDAAGRAASTRVLQEIHRLYTVYADLLLFDGDGEVVASAVDDAASASAGRRLDAEWVARTLALADPGGWTVSAFEPTPLYAGRPTCVFGAAVRGAADPRRVVGGIAIVFDAEPQFEAMLADTLPRGEDGAVVDGAFNLFVDTAGRVVARTGGGPPVGERFEGGAGIDGDRGASIVERDGRLWSFAARVSSGYREYRSGPDPRGLAVSAVCAVPLASAADTAAAPGATPRPSAPRRATGEGDRIELATVRVAGQWYALRGADVIEAIGGRRILSLPSVGACVRGSVMHGGRPVLVVDLALLMGGARAGEDPGVGSIVVVRAGEAFPSFGLWVDGLGDNLQVDADALQSIGSAPSLIAAVLRPGADAPAQDLLGLLSLPNVAAAAFGSSALARAA